MNSITIDVAKIRDTALKGVRRTTIFLGLGTNAAADERLTDYSLEKHSTLNLVPDDVDGEGLEHFKTEFGRWIISSGIRELIEWFAIYLDQVHHAGLAILLHAKEITQEQASQWHRSFHYKGVKDKLKLLKNRFGFDTSQLLNIPSIQDARNCLTHRAGVVSNNDVNEDGKLKVKWLAFDAFIEEPNGNKVDLNSPIGAPVKLENGGEVKTQLVERVKEFEVGEVVSFTPAELQEICFSIIIATDKVIPQLVDLAKAKNVPINRQT